MEVKSAALKLLQFELEYLFFNKQIVSTQLAEASAVVDHFGGMI
jgi:hypothetical protein